MEFRDMRLLLMVIVGLFACFSCAGEIFFVWAQPGPQPQSNCPQTEVVCPDSVSKTGKLTYRATIKGGDQNVTPTFNWTVSQGSISSGQGTTAIELDLTEAVEGTTVTASVEVGGFPRDCGYGSTVASCTTIINKKVEARKMDEFGGIKPADQEPRLDNFVIELQTDPTAQGYIVSYGGHASRPGDAKKAAEKAKAYMVKKRRVDSARLMIIDAGQREQATLELWVVPSGAEPPMAAPPVAPPPAKPTAKPKKRTGKKS